MSFLDNTGLAYFYSKLKEKFVQTVNGNLPENGNVEITNVATADNLTSADTLQFYDTYIGRISGGSADISNGDAYLSRIDGNVNIVGRVVEDLKATANNDLNVTTNISLWRTQISVSGNYNFYYNKSTSFNNITEWVGSEIWTFGGENKNLATYGLTVEYLKMPSIFVSTSASGITGATVIPDTWMNSISEAGMHEFIYVEDSESGNYWSFRGNRITLSDYGIETTGTAVDGDKITITYVSGTPNSIINVVYTAPVQGTIQVAKPTSFVSTGYNQFNKNSTDFYLADASIENGEIVSSIGNYVCFCKAYAGSPQGYMAHSAGGYIIDGGWCATLPQIGSILNQTQQEEDLKGTNFYSITFENTGYFVVAVSNISDLCIHIRWDGEEDEVDEEYVEPSIIELPMVGTIGDDETLIPLPLSTYGMPAVGDVADTLNLDESIYIQRIGVYENTTQNMDEVRGMSVPYDFDTNYIYYVLESPISYKIPSIIDDKEVTSKYVVNDLGTEEFTGTIVPVGAWNIYGENLRNKLKVNVLTISEQNPALNDHQLKQICKNLKLLDIIYPIGSIYMSVNNTNPGNFLGGSWERIKGCFLLAATDGGASGGNSNASIAPGGMGGEATHTLTVTEMPSHNHSYPYLVAASGTGGTNRRYIQNGETGNTGSKGGGAAHNNMPPYLAVYVWKRTV